MSRKKYANFYTDRKYKTINHHLVKVSDKNNFLFANGIYKTKILEEHLPEYFVKLYFGVKNQYISVRNIKDILYKPNYFTSHLYKDDFLYISYDKPIIRNKTDNYYINYEVLIYGSAIIDFIKALKENNTYDVKNIEEELNKKREWFKNIDK